MTATYYFVELIVENRKKCPTLHGGYFIRFNASKYFHIIQFSWTQHVRSVPTHGTRLIIVAKSLKFNFQDLESGIIIGRANVTWIWPFMGCDWISHTATKTHRDKWSAEIYFWLYNFNMNFSIHYSRQKVSNRTTIYLFLLTFAKIEHSSQT